MSREKTEADHDEESSDIKGVLHIGIGPCRRHLTVLAEVTRRPETARLSNQDKGQAADKEVAPGSRRNNKEDNYAKNRNGFVSDLLKKSFQCGSQKDCIWGVYFKKGGQFKGKYGN